MTKTWQEEKIKHTAEHLGIISEGALKTLVSDIRKKDEEELIKMLPQDLGTDRYNWFKDGKKNVIKLIQDYYNK